MLRPIQNIDFGRDAKLLISSVGIASLSGGFAGVVQNIYLSMLGFPPVLIGLVVSVATVSSSLRMVFFGILSDKIGRKKVIFLIFLTSVLYNLIYFSALDYPFFLLAAIIGGAGGEGYGGYVEGSLLSEKVGDSRRNLAFSIQYFIGSSLSAFGNLASALPEIIMLSYGIPPLDAVRLVFALQACLIVAATSLIIFVTETPRKKESREERYLSKESQRKILKLSACGLFDGFGVGMFMNLSSLWFHLRFGMGIKSVGYIFTFSKIFESMAYLIGPSIAKRKGLVWTFCIARFGGGVAAGIMAFMPTYALAAVMYTTRNTIQHIGTSLRTSYTIAIFNRSERASATSISNLTSTAANTTATSISGYLMQAVDLFISPFLSAFFIGAAAELYYIFFKKIKPPEEQIR